MLLMTMEEVMMKLVKIILVLIVCLVFNCHVLSASTHHENHHKLRHYKHKIVHINDHHVNEIREAFEDYKRAVKKRAEISNNHAKFDDDLTEDASDEDSIYKKNEIIYESRPKMLSKLQTTFRYKRVDAPEFPTDEKIETTTIINNENKKIDSGGVKVHEEGRNQTLTEYKFNTFGTTEGVKAEFEREKLRNHRKLMDNKHTTDYAKIKALVVQNIRRTKTEGKCQWPSKKVIEMPYHPQKSYLPLKYVVYQCSDDTACCGSLSKSCVAKTYDEIVLWFNVRHLDRHTKLPPYEHIIVQNHTECQCVSKDQNHVRNEYQHPTQPTVIGRSLACLCPVGFKAENRSGSGGEDCSCMCVHGNRECHGKHIGQEVFSIKDQSCIKTKKCEQPDCKYGSYSQSKGRCLRHDEFMRKSTSSRNFTTHKK